MTDKTRPDQPRQNQAPADAAVLQHQLENLPRELIPERDLWAGIDHAIEHQQGRSDGKRAPWLGAAAMVAVGVVVGWMSFRGPAPEAPMTLAALAQEMNRDFDAQRRTVLVSFGQQDYSGLSRPLQAELEQLDAGIQAVNQALAADPENAELLELLGFLQQQALDLLARSYQPGWQML